MGALPLWCLYSEVGSDMCYEEGKIKYCQRECLELGLVILARVVKSGLTELVTFEVRTENGKEGMYSKHKE